MTSATSSFAPIHFRRSSSKQNARQHCLSLAHFNGMHYSVNLICIQVQITSTEKPTSSWVLLSFSLFWVWLFRLPVLWPFLLFWLVRGFVKRHHDPDCALRLFLCCYGSKRKLSCWKQQGGRSGKGEKESQRADFERIRLRFPCKCPPTMRVTLSFTERLSLAPCLPPQF